MIELPASFVRTTLDREGTAATSWLAALPAAAELLMTHWGCLPDGEVTHGGVGIVIPVLRTAEPAVLKLSPRHTANLREPDALAAWNGHGAVRLLERDDEHGAMLLERAHRTTLRQVASDDEVAQAAGGLHQLLTVPAPPCLPRLQDQADAWERQLYRDRHELAHALTTQAVDAALATIRDLGRDQPGLVVHGDYHARNILAADRTPWLAIDPKGAVGDPAYDTGILVKARAWQIHERGDLRPAVHASWTCSRRQLAWNGSGRSGGHSSMRSRQRSTGAATVSALHGPARSATRSSSSRSTWRTCSPNRSGRRSAAPDIA